MNHTVFRTIRSCRLAQISLLLGLFGLVAAVPMAGYELQGRWLQTGEMGRPFFKLWLFWAVWACVPFTLLAVLHLLRSRRHGAPKRAQARTWLAMLVLLVGVWSSLIEPRLQGVDTHQIDLPEGAQPLRLALISDLHLGLFWRPWQLRQLVASINSLGVDAVLVAGDWTYDPPQDLHAAFAPLQAVKAPIYGVLGNHDLQAPGASHTQALRQALTDVGVHLLDGQQTTLHGWTLVGIGDLWGDNPASHIRQHLQEPKAHRLVLTHQPDVAADFPPHASWLTLSGHTHGGQIKLPFLTQKVLEGSTRNPWYHGLYDLPQGGKLLVSGGIGTIGLPARLGVKPRIELILLGHKQAGQGRP